VKIVLGSSPIRFTSGNRKSVLLIDCGTGTASLREGGTHHLNELPSKQAATAVRAARVAPLCRERSDRPRSLRSRSFCFQPASSQVGMLSPLIKESLPLHVFIIRYAVVLRTPIFVLLVIACCDMAVRTHASRAAVIGVFDESRAGIANVATGVFTTLARDEVLTNSHRPVSPPRHDDAGVLGPCRYDSDPVGRGLGDRHRPLIGGGTNGGVQLREEWRPSHDSGRRLHVRPFRPVARCSLRTDGRRRRTERSPTRLDPTPVAPDFRRSVGIQSTISVYGAGYLYQPGPYAQSLATMDSTGYPILAVIEKDAIAPGSRRVLLYSDAPMFADPILENPIFMTPRRSF
jgi:hypothetical protein